MLYCYITAIAVALLLPSVVCCRGICLAGIQARYYYGLHANVPCGYGESGRRFNCKAHCQDEPSIGRGRGWNRARVWQGFYRDCLGGGWPGAGNDDHRSLSRSSETNKCQAGDVFAAVRILRSAWLAGISYAQIANEKLSRRWSRSLVNHPIWSMV